MALTALTNRTAAASGDDSLLDFLRRRFESMYTIRRRVKDGTLPYERVGIKYYVRLSALEALERVKVSPDRGIDQRHG